MIAPALALLLTLSTAQDTQGRVKSDVKAAVKQTGEAGKKVGRVAKERGKEVGREAKPAGKRIGEKFKALGKDIAKGSKEAAKEMKETVKKK